MQRIECMLADPFQSEQITFFNMPLSCALIVEVLLNTMNADNKKEIILSVSTGFLN